MSEQEKKIVICAQCKHRRWNLKHLESSCYSPSYRPWSLDVVTGRKRRDGPEICAWQNMLGACPNFEAKEPKTPKTTKRLCPGPIVGIVIGLVAPWWLCAAIIAAWFALTRWGSGIRAWVMDKIKAALVTHLSMSETGNEKT